MPSRRQWMLWVTGSLACTALMWVVASGCGPMQEPDTDDEMLKAKGLLANTSEVTDSIDPETGDKLDWRVFEYFEKANVTVTYRVGDPFKGHDIHGVIELYDTSGNKLASKTVVPGTVAYEIAWTAEAQTKYFLVFSASKGESHYLIDAKATPADPCAACGDDEMCAEGRCVPKRRECSPECDPGFECDTSVGRCVEIECEAGEYFDTDDNECKPDPCYRYKCARGERCRSRRGKAYCYKPSRKSPDCEPACKSGQTCRSGKCVDVASSPKCPDKCPAGQTCDEKSGTCKAGNITAKILNYWPEGSSTIMLLNKGSEHGIKKGMTGGISGGGSVTVIEVYPYQCRAKTSLSRDQLAGKKSVTIKP